MFNSVLINMTKASMYILSFEACICRKLHATDVVRDFLIYDVIALFYGIFSFDQVLGQCKWHASLDSDFVYGECILHNLNLFVRNWKMYIHQ